MIFLTIFFFPVSLMKFFELFFIHFSKIQISLSFFFFRFNFLLWVSLPLILKLTEIRFHRVISSPATYIKGCRRYSFHNLRKLKHQITAASRIFIGQNPNSSSFIDRIVIFLCLHCILSPIEDRDNCFPVSV